MQVRLLGLEDAEALRELRLEALRHDRDAFLTVWEEERELTVEAFRQRMREGAKDPAYAVVGAFAGETLVGMVGCFRTPHRRARHKAHIWGMWVAPGARRAGVGRAMLEALLAHLRAVGGIEEVRLSVTTGPEQAPARALYGSLGFVRWGLEERAMKEDGRVLDEEHLALRLA